MPMEEETNCVAFWLELLCTTCRCCDRRESLGCPWASKSNLRLSPDLFDFQGQFGWPKPTRYGARKEVRAALLGQQRRCVIAMFKGCPCWDGKVCKRTCARGDCSASSDDFFQPCETGWWIVWVKSHAMRPSDHEDAQLRVGKVLG
jgi:hypothetical protein